MEYKIVADLQNQTGEGPNWHAAEQKLYWLDIMGEKMHRYDPATGQSELVLDGHMIGVLTVQEDGALLLFMKDGRIALWRDGQFVKDMVDDPVDCTMVEAIAGIAQVMGLRTVAESVESRAVLRLLGQIGIDYAQGYVVGRPRPFASDFEL